MRADTTRLARWVRVWLTKIPPSFRMPLVIGLYTAGLAASLWLAYQIRFDFAVPGPERERLWNAALWIIPLKLALLLLIGQFAGLLSYFSVPDVRRLFLTLATATLLITFVWWWPIWRFRCWGCRPSVSSSVGSGKVSSAGMSRPTHNCAWASSAPARPALRWRASY